jgi:hypothetical protein
LGVVGISLVLKEASHLILRVAVVPHLDKLVTGHADVFAVDDGTAEGAGDVQAVCENRIGAEGI